MTHIRYFFIVKPHVSSGTSRVLIKYLYAININKRRLVISEVNISITIYHILFSDDKNNVKSQVLGLLKNKIEKIALLYKYSNVNWSIITN